MHRFFQYQGNDTVRMLCRYDPELDFTGVVRYAARTGASALKVGMRREVGAGGSGPSAVVLEGVTFQGNFGQQAGALFIGQVSG